MVWQAVGVIPEPASTAVLLAGLVPFGLVRLRRGRGKAESADTDSRTLS